MFFVSTSDPDASRRNLLWLCLLRFILIAVLVAGSLILDWLESLSLLKDGGVLTALFLLTGINITSLWYLRQGRGVSEIALFFQLVLDILLMSLVFYRTGGSTNPFVFWYLLPLSIAAATLRLKYSLMLTALTLFFYTLLLTHYVPFEFFSSVTHAHHLQAMSGMEMPRDDVLQKFFGMSDSGFNMHIFGMWLNFIFSAVLITIFVTRMNETLRAQDRMLAQQHESLLQREQVVSLGALAAGAAHELGTPLSTMTLLAKEIEYDLPKDSPLHNDIVLLKHQIDVCRGILKGLREQAQGQQQITWSAFIRTITERMEVIYPSCRFVLADTFPAGEILPPPTLQQVVINLLDNAAQAAKSVVKIYVINEKMNYVVMVEDDGVGIAPEMVEHLGKAFVTNKEDGMGLGYFLSHASINQLGGSIHFKKRTQGGTCVELRLPRQVFETKET